MSRIFLFLALICGACTGSLTKEQRENIRENMKNGAIQKVSEAEILDAAYALGRSVVDAYQADVAAKAGLEKTHQVLIRELLPGQPGLSDKEQGLLAAYVAGAGENKVGDNVQKLGTDTIIYTKPVTRERPDGSLEFIKAIGVRMPVKQIVLSIQE